MFMFRCAFRPSRQSLSVLQVFFFFFYSVCSHKFPGDILLCDLPHHNASREIRIPSTIVLNSIKQHPITFLA
uniref:Putative secreted protein n=1 Tax=Ixodes ricinus TaxID=34613 RepID=A0A147BLK7_IXORI